MDGPGAVDVAFDALAGRDQALDKVTYHPAAGSGLRKRCRQRQVVEQHPRSPERPRSTRTEESPGASEAGRLDATYVYS